MKTNTSISNILILISIFATLAVYINPNIFNFGMNRFFLDNGIYHIYVLQFFSSQFIHGWLFHLILNSVFIFYFGNIVESIIGRSRFMVFFITQAIFIWLALSYLQPYANTVWISGFAMAVLSYYALEMRARTEFQESQWAITALVINILIGFAPGISLVGHFAGMVWGIIFYYLNKSFFTLKYIGKQKTPESILRSNSVVGEMNEKL